MFERRPDMEDKEQEDELCADFVQGFQASFSGFRSAIPRHVRQWNEVKYLVLNGQRRGRYHGPSHERHANHQNIKSDMGEFRTRFLPSFHTVWERRRFMGQPPHQTKNGEE